MAQDVLPSRPGAEVTVCVTCQGGERRAGGAPMSGQRLRDRLEVAIAQHPTLDTVRVTSHRCLMACQRGCAVALRQPGKMAYVLGDFSNDAAVGAIVRYLERYCQSDDGIVPFAHWPHGVKGHFVARLPPLEADAPAEETPR